MTFGALGGCSKQQPRTDDGMEEEEVAGETTRLVVPIVTATSTSSAATAANKTEPTSRTSSTPAEDDAANNPQRRQSIVEPRDILGLGIDILIFVSVQFVLRTQFHCSNVKTCESPNIIPYGRGFFFLTIVVLTTIYSTQISVAKSLLRTSRRRRNPEDNTTPFLPTTTTTTTTTMLMTEAEEEEITQDIQILQKKLLKGLVKPCILGTLHFTLGLMALLFVSSCRAINSLPFWRQRDRSYYYKYGRGRTRNE